MIERKFVEEKLKEFQIEEFVDAHLRGAGHSHTKLVKTPLGEKIVVYASRPGLVVGRKGENIKQLTKTLKKKFNLENPQLEISEIENPNLDARIVAHKIAESLERFGTNKFKAVGHKAMTDVMNAGALGVEIRISGKVPSARAKSWRFYSGYIKKCGDVALTFVDKADFYAQLKSGTIGVKVRIMPPMINLPDRVDWKEEKKAEVKTAEKDDKTVGKIAPAADTEKKEPKEPVKAEKKEKEKKETEEKPKRKRSRKKKEEAEAHAENQGD